MTNWGCSSAAQRRIHPVVRLRWSLWILRCAQNDMGGSSRSGRCEIGNTAIEPLQQPLPCGKLVCRPVQAALNTIRGCHTGLSTTARPRLGSAVIRRHNAKWVNIFVGYRALSVLQRPITAATSSTPRVAGQLLTFVRPTHSFDSRRPGRIFAISPWTLPSISPWKTMCCIPFSSSRWPTPRQRPLPQSIAWRRHCGRIFF